jgi:Ribonuclease G/E
MRHVRCFARRAIRLAKQVEASRGAEWLYEDGIGEERALLLENGIAAEACIERHGEIKVGLVSKARLVKQLIAGKRGIAVLPNGSELLVSPLPKGVTEGAEMIVEVRRAAISEQTRLKLPLARPSKDQTPRAAPTLLERIDASGLPIRRCHAHEADHFAENGWHEIIETARSGQSDFPGGSLIISVTAAMTVIDVDGDGPAQKLALGAAEACAKAIRLLGLQGSIGIDFPGMESKADRQSVADALDEAMTGDFERTAINGFGFMQIVKRRVGPSLPERLQSGPMRAHALEMLRRAERAGGTGAIQLRAHPAIIQALEKHPDWIAELERRTGRPVSLHMDPKLAIGGGYVQ